MPSTEATHDGVFPRCLEQLSAEWLSEITKLPVAKFEALDIGEGKGMLGDVWRLRLEVTGQAPVSVVAKFSAQRESSLPLTRRAEIFEREINFYRNIAPHLRCRMPRVFGCWHEQERAEFLIVMEHIDADSSVDQKKGVTYEQAAQVMAELAALHSFNVGQSGIAEGLAIVEAPERRANQKLFIERGWDKLKELLPSESVGVPSTDLLLEGIHSAYDRLAAEPKVLCHGDVRPDNLLFSRIHASVALIDWQGVALGPRSWDIAYFFAQGLRVEDRREWQSTLIERYVAASAALGTTVDATQIVENIGSAAWFSFAVACSLFTVADATQPSTLALAKSMGERAVNFLKDEEEF